MSKLVTRVLKQNIKRRFRLELLAHEIRLDEARLTKMASLGNRVAEELAANLSCLCFDYLQPAIDSLGRALSPSRPTELEPELEIEAPQRGSAPC